MSLVDPDQRGAMAALAGLESLVRSWAADEARRVLAERAPQPGPELMTIPEAANLLRTSRARIDNLLSSGALTRIKDGRRTLLKRSEIGAYLREERRQ